MRLPAQYWIVSATTQRLLTAFGEVPLRFVGGCVRDAIMGRAVGDIDCATPATPQQTSALLEAAGIKAIPTGIAHGTVTAVVNGIPYEITTLRRDISCDGRHAEIAFTDDWQEDAKRRDFTMNAIFCDASGLLYDSVGGIADAQAGRVRFIGDASARIREDALRILRFFRFSASHGNGELNADALAACSAHAAMLATLSGERIQHEMLKLLAAANPYPALEAMDKAEVVEVIIPSFRRRPESMPHNIIPALASAGMTQSFALLRLALLLEGEAATLQLATRWRLSNAQRDLLLLLVTHPYRDWPNGDGEIIDVARHLPPESYALLLRRNAARLGIDDSALEATLALAARLEMPLFPVSGADLLALGIKEGAEIGAILRRLEATWQQSAYALSREALLAQVK